MKFNELCNLLGPNIGLLYISTENFEIYKNEGLLLLAIPTHFIAGYKRLWSVNLH